MHFTILIIVQAEHYSSIRNLTGPDTGLPHVKPTDLKALTASQAAAAVPTKTLKIEQWMVNSVSSSLPNFVDEATITKTLLLNKGNVDSTVSQLLLEDNSTPPSSGPSSPDSSFSAQSGNYSIVRDEESEDEDKIYGPTRRKARKEKEEAEKAEKEKEKEKLIYQDETEVKQRCEKELAAIPLSMWNLTTLMI